VTQKDRILQILKTNREVSNYELRSIQPPVFQYPVRIHELQQEGHQILGYPDAHDRRKYWYKYIEPKMDLFDER
jgi:hypothetical protein